MVLEGIRKAISTANPFNRNPEPRPGAMVDLYPFIVGASQASKASQMGWQTYYAAMDQEWVSACIGAIITEILGANFGVIAPDEQNVAPDHEAYLTDLFQWPEGHESDETYTSFAWKCWSSFLGTGDCFIEVAENSVQRGVPAGFYFIPPHKMAWNREQNAWGYAGSNIVFEAGELIHVKMPNPWNNTWGKSPIDNISRSLTLDILAWQFNKDFFKSGLHPRGIFEYDPTIIGEDVYNRQTAEMKAKMDQNPRGNIFLYGGHYQDIGATNKDMEFMQLTDKVRDRILSVYGVPPQKVGIYTTSTLGADQDSGADKNFWKKRRGEIKLFEDAFNNVIGKDSGWIEEFEIPQVDIENKLLRAQTEDIRIKNNSAMINEIRAGYSEDDVAWGNTPYTQLLGGASAPNPAAAGVKRWMQEKGIYKE
jgi:Phage portal protein